MPPAPVVRYGDHPDQVANLHHFGGESERSPVVVLVHGGFWRERWDRTTATPLASDLAARGYLAWNIEYRRVGQVGGGWPGTLDDVAAAVDALADVEGADLEHLAAVGHSAGGQLALWLAARLRPRVRLRAAVSLAGVVDLERGAREGLGDGAVTALLGGGPDDVPERYSSASPAALLPLGVPQLLVHGADDAIVPPHQSRAYAELARAAGDDVELVEVAGADHFDLIDPGHDAWAAVVARLPSLLGLERRLSPDPACVPPTPEAGEAKHGAGEAGGGLRGQ
jgi:acetyl esterase/lipase